MAAPFIKPQNRAAQPPISNDIVLASKAVHKSLSDQFGKSLPGMVDERLDERLGALEDKFQGQVDQMEGAAAARATVAVAEVMKPLVKADVLEAIALERASREAWQKSVDDRVSRLEERQDRIDGKVDQLGDKVLALLSEMRSAMEHRMAQHDEGYMKSLEKHANTMVAMVKGLEEAVRAIPPAPAPQVTVQASEVNPVFEVPSPNVTNNYTLPEINPVFQSPDVKPVFNVPQQAPPVVQVAGPEEQLVDRDESLLKMFEKMLAAKPSKPRKVKKNITYNQVTGRPEEIIEEDITDKE